MQLLDRPYALDVAASAAVCDVTGFWAGLGKAATGSLSPYARRGVRRG